VIRTLEEIRRSRVSLESWLRPTSSSHPSSATPDEFGSPTTRHIQKESVVETRTSQQVRTDLGFPSGAETCGVCGAEIKMMVRRGTGICSENCEKKQRGEETTADHMEGVGHHASE
jgi:hypothetical protein